MDDINLTPNGFRVMADDELATWWIEASELIPLMLMLGHLNEDVGHPAKAKRYFDIADSCSSILADIESEFVSRWRAGRALAYQTTSGDINHQAAVAARTAADA